MITIFTPTYNRAYIIHKLYKSLCTQTDKRFEWLILDDGSNDDIKDVVRKFQTRDNGFIINFISRNNGGKHRAINYALDVITTEWLFIVDSDDYLDKDAIKKVYKWIEETRNLDRLIGVSGQRGFSSGELNGAFPKNFNYIDVKQTERKKRGILGDKAEIYKTEILKTKRFPEFKNENYISEGALLYQFAMEGYIVRYYPDIIYFGEYLDDGLTKSKNLNLNNYNGYCFFEKLNIQTSKFPNNILAKIRYLDVSLQKGIDRNIIISELSIGNIQFIFLFILRKIKNILNN